MVTVASALSSPQVASAMISYSPAADVFTVYVLVLPSSDQVPSSSPAHVQVTSSLKFAAVAVIVTAVPTSTSSAGETASVTVGGGGAVTVMVVEAVLDVVPSEAVAEMVYVSATDVSTVNVLVFPSFTAVPLFPDQVHVVTGLLKSVAVAVIVTTPPTTTSVALASSDTPGSPATSQSISTLLRYMAPLSDRIPM